MMMGSLDIPFHNSSHPPFPFHIHHTFIIFMEVSCCIGVNI